MKKAFVLLAITLFITNCSKDSNNSNSINENKPKKGLFNPPAWIQGEWKWSITMSGITNSESYTFTSNNVKHKIVSGSSEVVSRDFLKLYDNPATIVKEEIKDKVYKIIVTPKVSGSSVSNNQGISFTKISSNQIQISVAGIKGYTFTKQ